MNIYDIIKRPIITEKTSVMAGELKQFTFEVDVRANKIEIKDAMERLFNVDVLKVATLILPLKRARRGRKYYNRTSEYKKAIVTVAAVSPDLGKLFNV